MKPAIYELMKYFKFYFLFLSLLFSVEADSQENSDTFCEDSVECFDNKLYLVAEKLPRFYQAECENLTNEQERKQCADQAMLLKIYKNIRWPKELQNWCGGGRVILRFIVKTDGSITDIEVIRGLHELFDMEAIRVVNLLDKWTPGTINDKAADMPYHLPIQIRLE